MVTTTKSYSKPDNYINPCSERGTLVLTRNHDQSVFITTPSGELITIKILQREGHRLSNLVKLAINAPLSFTVDREEIYRRKYKEEEIIN